MDNFPETALVIIVPEVDPFVKTLRDKYYPLAAGSIPAHITINYPFHPRVQSEISLHNRLSALFSTIQSFEFTLNEIGKFPGVLFLKPTPEDPFHHLVNTVLQEFPESPPYGGTHKKLIPHLTVAHSQFIEDYTKVEDEIEKKLQGLIPIHSYASKVTCLEYKNNAWSKRISFDLDNPGN